MDIKNKGINELKSYLDSKKRIVIKIGTQVLLDKNGRLSRTSFGRICGFSYSLIEKGKEVVLVSSGAIAAGKGFLNIPPGGAKYSIPERQAFAACGQSILMNNYACCFKTYGIKTAQVLLTKDDITNRQRFLNARNTINEILRNKVVPVINENDTVSYEEIKFSDNDHLSALVSNLACADMLLILSNVKGVYDKNPLIYKDSKLLKTIGDINNFVKTFKDVSRSIHGTGGMKSKLYASFIASEAGIDTAIISGKNSRDLNSFAQGRLNGTFIPSLKSDISKKQHWLLFGMEKKGRIIVDRGAEEAIVHKNKSLLSSGIIDIIGEFKKGEGLYIVGMDGNIISMGISNLDSSLARRIKGLKSSEIKDKFGEEAVSPVVVHKDKLAVSS